MLLNSVLSLSIRRKQLWLTFGFHKSVSFQENAYNLFQFARRAPLSDKIPQKVIKTENSSTGHFKSNSMALLQYKKNLNYVVRT